MCGDLPLPSLKSHVDGINFKNFKRKDWKRSNHLVCFLRRTRIPRYLETSGVYGISNFYLNKWDYSETTTRTTIIILFIFWKMPFSKIGYSSKSPSRHTYLFLHFSFPKKYLVGGKKKKRPICPEKCSGFAGGTIIFARSIPTRFPQKTHTQHLNLSFISAVGFKMHNSISINGCHAHINPLAVNDWADPIGDICWTVKRIMPKLFSTAWLIFFHFHFCA